MSDRPDKDSLFAHPDGEETMPEGKWNYTDHGGAAIQPGQTGVAYQANAPETWLATAGLRFVYRNRADATTGAWSNRASVLQQLWQSDSGKREWRDIPVESE